MFLNVFYSIFLITNTFNWIFSKYNNLLIEEKLSLYFYRHNRLINNAAILETLRGNSIASIPFNITLYVFIGSGPENGGLQLENLHICYNS
jgi:hypothetical protein